LQESVPFRNYYIDAIAYSRWAVPIFDQEKHLSPHFSGFVSPVYIYEKNARSWLQIPIPIFEAQGAYIQNGKIIWSIHDWHGSSSNPGLWKDSLVKWHSGNFILEEGYLDEYTRLPDQPAPKPSFQVRNVAFPFIDKFIKEVQVKQWFNRENKEEEFVIDIISNDNTYKKIIANKSTHAELFSQIKADPTFLSNIDNIGHLLKE